MTRTLKLTIAYDGTDFHGWQSQAGMRTVQSELTDIARRVIGLPISITGASRTDAGVHAVGQVAHMRLDSPIPTENIRRAINHRLPDDVTIVSIAETHDGFNAIRDARHKQYRYRIFPGEQRPVADLRQRFTWHVWVPQAIEQMRAAAQRMVGTRDFAAFASPGSPRHSTVRTVSRVDVRDEAPEIVIDVEGDGFLYQQVRNMVGTLVEVGRGHWTPDRVSEALESCSREDAAGAAPPQGLCLRWIRYDEPNDARPMSQGDEDEPA
ncbi:MAG: tRNA pseudouridine(38-40) synthase TruA [Phycisphaerales bacterium]|nr:tRNA pseudouridine(38-40) synthase TruA [Phycisphaerales bacterium]